MQTYNVKLESQPTDSFRCQMAANSLDIDVKKKLTHEISISADIESPFNIGLIIGASGSGKTTLAKQIFGENCFNVNIDPNKPIIEQLNPKFSYEECSNILGGIGLTSVPCWIRPVKTLSNGQRSRAEAALAMTSTEQLILIDEWTSVVDRTVAKVMSHCIQKFARKMNKKIILLSCHYDVIEWLNPDFVIDCNKQEFNNRRLLRPEERERNERLDFQIREVDRSSWKYFSKYHYLSEKIPGGQNYHYGLFSGKNQIGFQNFSNYVPTRKGTTPIYHFNRTVIHPDYAGLGLGIHLINETSRLLKQKYGFKIMGKFSSTPVFKSMSKNKYWRLCEVKRQIGNMKIGGTMGRRAGNNTNGGFRKNIKTYSFQYIGP